MCREYYPKNLPETEATPPPLALQGLLFQERIRPLWRSYTRCTDGIIFVLDSAEQDKFDEAKLELFRTMKYQASAEHSTVSDENIYQSSV